MISPQKAQGPHSMPRIRPSRFALGPLLALVSLAACGGPGYTVPPITPSPTAERHVGSWVWFDLLTHDSQAVERFYGELFGWEFQSDGTDSPYTSVLHRGQPIAGIFQIEELEQDVRRARWVPYLSVQDVAVAVSVVQGQGGTVFADARTMKNRGEIAVVGDPQGAVFGVVYSDSGDPPDLPATPGGFLWTELWTKNVQDAVDFYHTLVGYTHVVVDFPGAGDYDVLHAEDKPQAGVIKLPFDEVLPHWLPYVLVDDPAALAARVEELGGRVLLGPHEELRGGSVAIISDPSGAAITIQKWPVEGGQVGRFPQ